MTKNACTQDNVLGLIAAHRVNDGLDLSLDALKEVDRYGQSHFVDIRNKTYAEAFDNAHGNTQIEADNQVISFLFGDKDNRVISGAKGVLSELRNPSGIFGEDFISPVREFIQNHYETHLNNLKAGRSEYMKGIKQVFEELDTSNLTHGQQVLFKQYKHFYLEGGELYNLNSKGALEKKVSDVVSNTIKSSPNVLIGNVLEAAIKLPTLYPKEFLPAIAKAIQKNPFKELPEVAKTGAYGLDFAGETKGIWGGLIGLTDKPLKNISYFAGEMAGHGGDYAIQKVAFTPRFGDLPPVYYHAGGQSAIKMLGYTVNSHRMYLGMWKGLANKETMAQSLQQLITYHGILGLLGGVSSALMGGGRDHLGSAISTMMPFGNIGQSVIEAVAPDTADWFDENRTFLTQLVQPSGVNRLGVGYDIASRNIQRVEQRFTDALEKAQAGDLMGAGLEMADAGLSSLMFTNGLMGDNQVQKALRMAKDIAIGELDWEDVPQEALDKYVPAMDIQLDE